MLCRMREQAAAAIGYSALCVRCSLPERARVFQPKIRPRGFGLHCETPRAGSAELPLTMIQGWKGQTRGMIDRASAKATICQKKP